MYYNGKAGIKFGSNCSKGRGVPIFLMGSFFFKISLIAQLLRIKFVRSWHLFCVKNLYYVKNLITIQIQTVSSLNIVSKFAQTVPGSTSVVISGCAQRSILFIVKFVS